MRAQVTPPDFTVSNVEVNQAIQAGTTTLVAGRSTMVRVRAKATGSVIGGSTIDALMRVFVNGVETADSPIYSHNGPLAVPFAGNPALDAAALNFIFIPPQSNNVTLQIELNPAGAAQLLETNYSNNGFSVGPLNFVCRGNAEIVYVPIDYRPSGGSVPNLPDPELIKPGVGDNFTQGIYPTPDWNYHRSVAPSKLWTSSLSGSGSSLLSALAVDINLMVPKPDFIYGWVPGPLPGYNGQAISIPGNAGMGNTEIVRFQRTMAHELGHLFGLSHNTTTANLYGVDVEEHLQITQNMPQILSNSQKDIMYAGLLTVEAWVAAPSYNHFLSSGTLACGQSDAQSEAASAPTQGLLVAGVWNRVAGTVELHDTLVLGAAQPSTGVALEASDLVLRAYQGGSLVSELPIVAQTSADHCAACRAGDSEDAVFPDASFAVVLPTGSFDPADIERLTVSESRSGTQLAELVQSAHAPELSFETPLAGVPALGKQKVSWSAHDADGDSLRFYLRYSPDGTRSVPLVTGWEAASFEVDFDALPKPVPNKGYLELIASDGLHTSRARREGLELATDALGGSNAPWTYILTPDSGNSYPKGATVILRGNSWDLEDLVIGGADAVWTSDLDGTIGIGRHTSVASLSVGTHVITYTATDSSGTSASASTSITITDRILPGGARTICQTDLGFGGPGSSVLSMCGADLGTGTGADFELVGAAPNAPLFLPISSFSSPTPIAGGTLVPVPIELLGIGTTDANGEFLLPLVAGGGGPATLYVQAVYADALLPQGWGFSNALEIQVLP